MKRNLKKNRLSLEKNKFDFSSFPYGRVPNFIRHRLDTQEEWVEAFENFIGSLAIEVCKKMASYIENENISIQYSFDFFKLSPNGSGKKLRRSSNIVLNITFTYETKEGNFPFLIFKKDLKNSYRDYWREVSYLYGLRKTEGRTTLEQSISNRLINSWEAHVNKAYFQKWSKIYFKESL